MPVYRRIPPIPSAGQGQFALRACRACRGCSLFQGNLDTFSMFSQRVVQSCSCFYPWVEASIGCFQEQQTESFWKLQSRARVLLRTALYFGSVRRLKFSRHQQHNDNSITALQLASCGLERFPARPAGGGR
eukprot:8204119-Alexandrium_andersonii.AAC.1